MTRRRGGSGRRDGQEPEPRPELPDVWEGPAPEERSYRSGLPDVYDGPDVEADLERAAEARHRAPGGSEGPVEAGAAMAEIFEAVRRSEEPDDDSEAHDSEAHHPDANASDAEGSDGGWAPAGESPLIRVETDRKARDELARTDVTVIHHVVVPAATIAMVGSLLFFLFDLRAAFVDGAFSLKWIGLCFVVATVLIARYARLMGEPENAALYSAALGVVTFVAMAMSPWEPPQTKAWGPLLNGLVLYVTWRFASRLTRNLSADLDDPTKRRRRLFGLERQALESIRRQQMADGTYVERLRIEQRRSDSESAQRDIARLTLVGLLIFALGEPILRIAQAELAGKALASMVSFLIAAGTLLGAASVAAQQRRLERLHASAPWTLVSGRVASALALTVLVLTLALQMPGVHVEGTGELRPQQADGRVGEGDAAGDDPSESSERGESRSRGDEAARSQSQPSEGEADRSRGTSPPSPSFSFVSPLTQLGALLRWPLLAVVAIAVTVFVVRWIARQENLGAALAKLAGGLAGHLQGLLADAWRRLCGGFGLLKFWRKKGGQGKTARRGDPFAAMAQLRTREPGDAVVGAYAVLQAALADFGHARRQEVTPLEYLRAIPGVLSRLRPAADRLTRLYLLAAYAPTRLGDAQRKQALDALEELRTASRLHADEIRRP